MNLIENAAGVGVPRARHSALVGCFLAALCVVTQGCGAAPEDTAETSVAETSEELSFFDVPGTNSPYFSDSGTQCWSPELSGWYHCCPPNSVMVGAHFGNNKFRCANVGVALSSVGNYTQRNGMLSCEFGKVMTGYYAGSIYPFVRPETVFCATPPSAIGWEYVDDGKQAISQDDGMHVCRKDTVNPGRFAMSGVQRNANRFNCFQ